MCARTQVHKYTLSCTPHPHNTNNTDTQRRQTERHKTNLPNLCPRGTARARLQPNIHTWISSQMRLRAQSYAHIYLHTQTQHVKRYTYISAEVQTHLQTTQTPQAHRHTHTNITDALHTKTDRQIDRHLCTGVPTLTHTYLQTANTLSCTSTNMQTHSPAHTLTNTHKQTPTYVQTCFLQTHIHTTQTTQTHMHTTHTTPTHMHIKHITQQPNTDR